MSFYKTATVQPLGSFYKGSWTKTAGRSVVSKYIDAFEVNLGEVLDEVAEFYKISSDPFDYLLVPARAVSADRPNENLDGWDYGELVRFDRKVGRRVYRTFEGKPHFVNHKSDNPIVARGVVVDASLNELNEADDMVKEAVFNATGKVPEKDIFTECLIAVDTTKDADLAAAYKEGIVSKFSMGCDVDYTVCSYCGNKAAAVSDFCHHIKNKFSRKAYKLPNGASHIPYEKCGETIFQELSAVDLPADRTAVIQDGIIQVVRPNTNKFASDMRLTKEDLSTLSSFVARHASSLTDEESKALYKVFYNN